MKKLIALFVCLACAPSAVAQTAPARTDWTFVGYFQQSFPKQTVTNQQIDDINASLGTSFPTWDDTVNANVGLLLLRSAGRHLKIGLEFDYSRGSIGGSETIPTLAGPATADFEQRYDSFVDFLGMVQFHPAPDRRASPFFYGAAGVAIEHDAASLKIANQFIDQRLEATNSATFLMTAIGAGIDVSLTKKLFLEITGGYSFGGASNMVTASGNLSPGQVIADTEIDGPNYSIGIGYRFGKTR